MLRTLFFKFMARAAREEDGLTAVEYAVLGALVVTAIGAISGFSTELTAAFNDLIKK